MKNLFSIALLLSLTIVAAPVSAREAEVEVEHKAEVRVGSTSLKNRIEVKGSVEDRKGPNSGSSSSSSHASSSVKEIRKASSTEYRIEIQQNVAKKLTAHTALVLRATIERLERIASRIESRIAKLKAGGEGTLEAETALAEARVHFSAARDSLNVFATMNLSAEKLQENFSKVREQASIVKMHIKEAHQSLSQAVRNLKGGSDSDNDKATSTNATSTSTN